MKLKNISINQRAALIVAALSAYFGLGFAIAGREPTGAEWAGMAAAWLLGWLDNARRYLSPSSDVRVMMQASALPAVGLWFALRMNGAEGWALLPLAIEYFGLGFGTGVGERAAVVIRIEKPVVIRIEKPSELD